MCGRDGVRACFSLLLTLSFLTFVFSHLTVCFITGSLILFSTAEG